MRLKRQYMEMVPIPDLTTGDAGVIRELAAKCSDARGVGCERWEKEIDERVAALYGL
ncbi:MAG TPA: hypothetical protein VGR35_13445 [Tepidisphaeraceae bacterium]|nr:hypothetical protein [Tepidisphaeraceae bacterium]